jgi:hypothetical protein
MAGGFHDAKRNGWEQKLNVKAGIALLSLIAGIAMAPGLVTAEEKPLGTFKDWQAYSFEEGGKTVCVVWGTPQKETGDYTKRGSVRLFVAHRAWARPKRVNEISIETGYTYKEDSDAVATIGSEKFDMFTDGDTAWNRAPEDDAKMIRAMRIGTEMVVAAESNRGTKTVDTYSLLGFTAAHNAINDACDVK